MNNINFALEYARLGMYVLPTWSTNEHRQCRCPLGQKCKAPGKHPQSILVPHGHNDATINLETIHKWWKTDPDAGIGISMASSGLLALDIDPRNGGWESLAAIEAQHGPMHSNCVAKTQGDGEHRLFIANPDMSFPGTLAAGLDLKYRGYICVEPTRGPDGEYRWLPDANPLEGAKPSNLPQFMRELSPKIPPAGKNFRPGSIEAASQVYSDLASALKAIPPEIDYINWLKVLLGLSRLRHTSKAYIIARDWSVQSKKPSHTLEAFNDKWDSVMKENSHVSYEWVFYLANLHNRNHSNATSQNKNPLSMPIQPFSEDEAQNAKLQPKVLVENFLFADLRNLIAAGGVGKTSMLLHEAVCGALARPIWGNKVPAPFTTVFVTKEDSREILLARLREIMQQMDLSLQDRGQVFKHVYVVDLSGAPYKLAQIIGGHVEPHIENLDALIEHCKPVNPDRIIFDPMVSFTAGESRVNEAEQGVVEAARYLMRKLNGIAVDIVHHTGKMNARAGAMDQYAGRNGSALPDGSRMVAVMASCSADNFFESTGQALDTNSGEKGLRLSFPKMSYTAQRPDVYILRRGFHFEAIEPASNELRIINQIARKEAGIQRTNDAIKQSIILAMRECADSSEPLDRYPSRSRIIGFPAVYGKTVKRKEALAELIAEGFLVERIFTADQLTEFSSTNVLAGRNTYIAMSEDEI